MSLKRAQLIETATTLFNQSGVHATGIDQIATQAGVTKRTLYKHFRSKEELVLAVLRDYDSVFRNEFMAAVEGQSLDANEKLLSIFDVARDWFRSKNFHGCMFVHTAGEFSAQESPILEACREHKRLMLDFIRKLSVETNATDPDSLSVSIALLFEGSIVSAHITGDSEAADRGKAAARTLLEAHTFAEA